MRFVCFNGILPRGPPNERLFDIFLEFFLARTTTYFAIFAMSTTTPPFPTSPSIHTYPTCPILTLCDITVRIGKLRRFGNPLAF